MVIPPPRPRFLAFVIGRQIRLRFGSSWPSPTLAVVELTDCLLRYNKGSFAGQPASNRNGSVPADHPTFANGSYPYRADTQAPQAGCPVLTRSCRSPVCGIGQ